MPKRYTPNDTWSQKAAAEGYRARSVYKLKELDEKFRLIQPGMTIVDLGAAPGSWLQYTAQCVGAKGKVIGIDLTEIEPIDGVETHVADITDTQLMDSIIPDRVDLILSDLAPKTSGIKDVDQWKSIELSQAVLAVARNHLKKGGTCVLKILRGGDFEEFLRGAKKEWGNVKTFSAKASRDRSKEIYVLLNL
jgi:23S rRNA (uridine2552-2'-O)-methyltransferase